jgi:hypothetical protein
VLGAPFRSGEQDNIQEEATVVGDSLNRRNFLKRAGLGAAAMAVSGRWGASQAMGGSTPARKPNVVLILIDDMGWTDLEC